MEKHAVKHTNKFAQGFKAVFIIVVFAVLIAPFACMSFARTDFLSGSTELAEFPNATTEAGAPNTDIMSELGKYFEDHFAFRPQMVTANAVLRKNLFNVSATSQVVAGSNDYLFYSDTLDDYNGTGQMTDVQLQMIAKNLKIVQEYLQANGSSFTFSVAPNKNTVYGNYMPWNYLQKAYAHNTQRLLKYLDAEGVSYINLADEMQSNGNENYLKTDSHWNNKGALFAANFYLRNAALQTLTVNDWIQRNDWDGDLQAMLYPRIIGNEQQYYQAGYNDGEGMSGANWSYTSGSAVTDSLISTKSKTANNNKSLYMYRDSFGNALIPYLSSAFASATYSKLIPYDFSEPVKKCSTNVFVERAERHLPMLADMAYIMPAPVATSINATSTANNSFDGSISVENDGNMIKFTGNLNSYNPSGDNIYIQLVDKNTGTSTMYKAFVVQDSESGQYQAVARLFKKDVDSQNSTVRFVRNNNGCNFCSKAYDISQF